MTRRVHDEHIEHHSADWRRGFPRLVSLAAPIADKFRRLNKQSCLLVVWCSIIVGSGCAHGSSPGYIDRFVAGRPTSSPVRAEKTAEPIPEATQLRGMSHVRRYTASSDLAVSDARLRSALLKLGLAETCANHYEVAVAFYQRGVEDLAEEHLSRALELDDTLAQAHDLRARIWRDWGFLPQALLYAHRAVFHASEDPTAQNTLGTILVAAGQFDQARIVFERALALDPSAPYAQANACALARTKQEVDVPCLEDGCRSCRRPVLLEPTAH